MDFHTVHSSTFFSLCLTPNKFAFTHFPCLYLMVHSNTTITLQTKQIKRRNTDSRCLEKMPPIQMATKAVRGGKLEVYSESYLFRGNDRQQELHYLLNAREEYLSNRLRTADKPLHHEQQWVFYSKLYFTMNSLL